MTLARYVQIYSPNLGDTMHINHAETQQMHATTQASIRLFTTVICIFVTCACVGSSGGGAAAGGGDDTSGTIADSGANAGNSDAVATDGGAAVTDTSTAIDAKGAADTVSTADTAAPTDAKTPTDAKASCLSGQFEDLNDGTCKAATCPNFSKSHGAWLKAALLANNDCSADADCEPAGQSTACMGACPVIINKANKANFSALVGKADAFCKANGVAAKCGYMTPGCLAPQPGCVSGKCVYTKKQTGTCPAQNFKPWGKTECVQATCQNKSKYKSLAINEALKKAQKCSKDDDCTIVSTSTKCSGSCGSAVNKGMKNDVAKVVGWVNDNICKVTGPDSPCPYATPDCMPAKPGCASGVCVYTKKGSP